MLVYNGTEVASADKLISLTQAQYDSLSDDDKMNGNAYFITDSSDEEYQKLLHISTLIGSEADLADVADGTIIGAIKDLYSRLGGLSFKIESGTNYLQATYNDEATGTVSSVTTINYLSDAEKINHLVELFGEESDLATTGHSTVVGAILGLYDALSGLSFAYNETTESIDVSNNDGES